MPLLLAAGNGDVATVERLLKAGAKVDGDAIFIAHEAPMRVTPLYTAAVAGHAAVIAVFWRRVPR
jgi:ankyrin repeat protein